MKKISIHTHIPLLVLGAGLLGAFARLLLYRFGADASGLLVRSHPLHILCWVLTIGVGIFVGITVWKTARINSYSANFPESKTALPVSVIAAAGIFITVLTHMDMDQMMGLIWVVLGLLSVPAVAAAGFLRSKGMRPRFYLYGVLCLFYACHLICRYQEWSGNPQLPDYSFQLLACGALTIGAYQRTAFSAGLGRRRTHLFCCLMAGFLCILSSVGSGYPLLYLTSGCYFLSDLAITLPKREE